MAKDNGPHKMSKPEGLPKFSPPLAQKDAPRPEKDIVRLVRPKIGGGRFKRQPILDIKVMRGKRQRSRSCARRSISTFRHCGQRRPLDSRAAAGNYL